MSKEKANIKSYASQYKYQRESIELTVFIKTKEALEIKASDYAVVLRERKSDKKLILDVTSITLPDGHTEVVVNLNAKKCLEMIEDDIVDFYLMDKENGFMSRISTELISEQMIHMALPDYYCADEKEFINLYETKFGNLSMKKSEGGSTLIIEAAELDEQGKLSLQGYLNCAKLDALNLKNDTTHAQIKNHNKEVISDLLISKYDMTSLEDEMSYTGVNYANCGFELTVDLLQIGKDSQKIVSKIYFIFSQDGDEIEISVTQPVTKHLAITRLIEVDGKTSWLFDLKGQNELTFILEDIKSDIEVREVYIKNECLEFVLETKSNGLSTTGAEIERIMLRNRQAIKSYVLPCTVQNEGVVTVVCDFNELAARESVDLDLYDVYFMTEGEVRRVASRSDNILNKKDIIVFPKLYIVDVNEKDLSIEPYYTDSNHLAMNFKKMMETKSISGIEPKKEGIVIKGKMYIRKPLIEDQNQFIGTLTVAVDYGQKMTLDFVVNVELLKNALVQHDFEMLIPQSSIDVNGYAVKEVLRNLSDSVAYCKITSTQEPRTLVLNLKAEHMKVTFEDKMMKTQLGKKLLNKISIPMYNMFNKVLPMDNKLVIFQSYYGKSYSCNPRAIYEELLETHPDFKSVWILNDPNKKLPGNAKVVRPRSLAYYYYMARAKYFINNANFPDFYQKRKGAINIETWHGTPLKRLGLDVSKTSKAYKDNTSQALLDRIKRWDSLIVPNKYTGEILTRAYAYENEVLEIGYPRNDIFYKDIEKRSAQVKERLNIAKDKKVIMYAPTWRENEKRTGSYKLPFSADEFTARFGEDYVLLLRLHYFDANRIDNSSYADCIRNVSFYDDIAELYLISDIMITDYSSVMFDYANSKKPMLFYTYDLSVYEGNLRGLYFDFKEAAPGPLVETEAELFESIRHIDEITAQYDEKYSEFAKKFCSLEDGYASKRAVENIFKK